MYRFTAKSPGKYRLGRAGFFPLAAAILLAATPLLATRSQPSLHQAILPHATAALATVRLGMGDLGRMHPLGRYRILVKVDGGWQETGQVRADAYMRTQEVALPPRARDGSGVVSVRIETLGGTNAHLDSVLLNGLPPLDSGWAPPGKLARTDHDLLRVFQKPLELTFTAPPPDVPLRLALTGRMQGEHMRSIPVLLPLENGKRRITPSARFYAYPAGAHPGSIRLDGDLEADRLGEPFFEALPPPSPGYPVSPIYGWVRNDETHLYVALDFTPDTTLDEGDDYAKVFVKTRDGVKSFRVTSRETRWGRGFYGYTSRVSWEHKFYEFAIPLVELGYARPLPPGKPLPLAVEIYGTYAYSKLDAAVAFNPTDHEFLAVYEDVQNDYISAQRLTANGDAAGAAITVSSGSYYVTPAVAFDPGNGRYLVVWDDNNEISTIRGRFVAADGTPDTSLGTFTISGTQSKTDVPAVTFDGNNEQFLVVWEYYDGTTTSIGFQLVDSRTATLGDLKIAGTGSFSSGETLKYPAVAVAPNATQAQFLIAWTNFDTSEIEGWLLPSTGSGGSAVSEIHAVSECTGTLAIAHDPVAGEFLVVFQDCPDGDAILGRRVDADGTLLGSGEISIATSNDTLDQPRVVFDSTRERYLVTWRRGFGDGEQEINARRVNANGATPDAEFVFFDGSGYDSTAFSHDLAFNTRCENYLGTTLATLGTESDFYQTVYLPCRLTVTPLAALTTEGGGAAKIYVALNSRPDENVVVKLVSQDTSEGTLNKGSLTFTPNNWSTFQNVTVTGQDDDLADGDQAYTVAVTIDPSSDPAYTVLDPPDVTLTNVDDETAGITVGPPSGPTTELGSTAAFIVVLNAQPAADVSIGLTSSDTTEGTVGTATLTFTPSNWDTPRTVVVTGVDDTEADGHQTYTIVTAAAVSDDPTYGGVDPADVAMTNIDDESIPLVLPLLTYPETVPTGVDPATGDAGTAFTFSVDYTSGLDKAPMIAELWIDLDGDGSYNTAAPTSAALHGPPAPPRESGLRAAGWAVGALLALLLLAAGRVTPSPAGRGALAVIGVAVLVGLLSCSSGGGGAGTEGQPTDGNGAPTGPSGPAGVQEVYQLTGAELNDGDFTNGETYEVSLTIEDAGSYTYRFVFYDDTYPAYGLPTAEQTLTVQ